MTPSSLDSSDVRVLIIDDDEDIRDTLTLLLRSKGIVNVDTATNGAEGFEKLKRADKPYAVLLDLMMPVSNGWDFLKKFETHPELSVHRVAIMSAGNPDRSTLAPYPFFQKPPDIRALLDFAQARSGHPKLP